MDRIPPPLPDEQIGGVVDPPRVCLLLPPVTLPLPETSRSLRPLVATDGVEELSDLGSGKAEGRTKAAAAVCAVASDMVRKTKGGGSFQTASFTSEQLETCCCCCQCLYEKKLLGQKSVPNFLEVSCRFLSSSFLVVIYNCHFTL